MRLYSITNMYTSGIHAGIQTAHLVHEVFRDPDLSSMQREILHDWADNHKTIIVLNGGYSSTIKKVSDDLWRLGRALELPSGYFRESDEALAGAWTATGIVVPAKIYERQDDEEAMYNLNSCELDLYQIIKSFPLAK